MPRYRKLTHQQPLRWTILDNKAWQSLVSAPTLLPEEAKNPVSASLGVAPLPEGMTTEALILELQGVVLQG